MIWPLTVSILLRHTAIACRRPGLAVAAFGAAGCQYNASAALGLRDSKGSSGETTVGQQPGRWPVVIEQIDRYGAFTGRGAIPDSPCSCPAVTVDSSNVLRRHRGRPAGASLYREIGRAITEGRQAHPSFHTAVRHHRLLDAVEQASRTGHRQEVAA